MVIFHNYVSHYQRVSVGGDHPWRASPKAEGGFRFSQLLRRDQVPDDDSNYLGRRPGWFGCKDGELPGDGR